MKPACHARFSSDTVAIASVSQRSSAPAPREEDTPFQLWLGMPVLALDDEWGEVADVVLDPVWLRVTDLVVRPSRGGEGPRLVPVAALTGCDAAVSVSWTSHRLFDAEPVQDVDCVDLATWPRTHDGWDVGVTCALAWPYYESCGDVGYADSLEPGFSAGVGAGYGPEARTLIRYDRIPAGTAEVRRVTEVIGSDDNVLGHLEGLDVDPDFGIRNVVVDRGHIWTHRAVTVPIKDVSRIRTDVINLRVRREALDTYPSDRIRHPLTHPFMSVATTRSPRG